MILRTAAIAFALTALAGPAAAQSALADWQWTHRPVLMFHGPETQENCAICEMGLTGTVADGLEERDIAFVEITDAGTRSWVDGTSGGPLAGSPAELRTRFGVADDAFAVILIGKDGGEKGRWDTPPSFADDIFPLIDAMPMRQREMREDAPANQKGQ